MKATTEKAKNKTKPKRPLFVLSSLIVWDAILFAVFIWANWVNFTDESGWSGFLTIPILLLVFVMLITTAIGFAVLAVKAPKNSLYRAYLFLGGALSLLPITCTLLYAVVSNSLAAAAKHRAETPITLQEAKQLVTTCQVETIYRHNGGQLQLNAMVPVMPGEDTYPEYRRYDVKYYDELWSLVRSKEVQDKCGFVPSYDDRRSNKTPIIKWITEDEAASILGACQHSTQFSRYASDRLPSGPNTTGILLTQYLDVWNDESDSTITLVGASESVRVTLEKKSNSCYR